MTLAAEPFEQWAHAARVPTYPGTVSLMRALCPGQPPEQGRPCTAFDGPRTSIYLPPDYRAEWPGDLRLTFYHELGHVFARYVMSPDALARFQRITGDRRDWYENTGTELWPSSPNEQIAQAYAYCAENPDAPVKPADVSDEAWTYSGWQPTPDQHRQACALFDAAAHPHRRALRRRHRHVPA